MKLTRPIVFAACVLAGLGTGTARALTTNVEQNLSISITGSYASTKVGPGAVTNITIKTATITTADVVKALAIDYNLFTGPVSSPGNISNGQLIHKISEPSGVESIVIRKGATETDVTANFSGGSLGTNFWETSGTNNYVKTELIQPKESRIKITDTLNSLSLTTTNISFVLSNGYGTAFGFNKGTNYSWKNLSCGGGALFIKNIGVLTNSALATNVTGPAQGTFSTGSGSVVVK